MPRTDKGCSNGKAHTSEFTLECRQTCLPRRILDFANLHLTDTDSIQMWPREGGVYDAVQGDEQESAAKTQSLQQQVSKIVQ